MEWKVQRRRTKANQPSGSNLKYRLRKNLNHLRVELMTKKDVVKRETMASVETYKITNTRLSLQESNRTRPTKTKRMKIPPMVDSYLWGGGVSSVFSLTCFRHNIILSFRTIQKCSRFSRLLLGAKLQNNSDAVVFVDWTRVV